MLGAPFPRFNARPATARSRTTLRSGACFGGSGNDAGRRSRLSLRSIPGSAACGGPVSERALRSAAVTGDMPLSVPSRGAPFEFRKADDARDSTTSAMRPERFDAIDPFWPDVVRGHEGSGRRLAGCWRMLRRATLPATG